MRSYWGISDSGSEFIASFIAVSSANSLIRDVTWSFMSLMFARNNIGPRTEPCGTPDETEILPEFMFRTMFSLPSEPATFVQRLSNVFQTSMAVHGVWNTLSSRCTNVAGSLGEPYAILNDI